MSYFNGVDTCGARTYKNVAGTLTYWQTLISSSTNVSHGLDPLLVVDLNVDGKLDVAVAEPGGVRIFPGNGDGTFAAAYKVATAGAINIAASNFDANKSPDLAVISAISCPDYLCPNYLNLYLNDGHGNFTYKSRTQIDGGTEIGATDLNGDGKMDIVGLEGSRNFGRLSYLLGHNDGTFSAQVNLPPPEAAEGLVLRDMNLDGRHDILYGVFIGGGTEILLNNNAGVICTPPGADTFRSKICSPGAGTTVPTTFTVRGSGNSPAGLLRLELWVDGVKRYETRNDQLSRTITVSAGTHQITVTAVDLYLGYAKKTITVTAQ